MNSSHVVDPAKRQVLVNIGNRFVVFGPTGTLPEPLRFDPASSPILPRVPDESEVAESRITETVEVAGMTRKPSAPGNSPEADLELVDAAGNRIIVEVKVREGDPKPRDLNSVIERLNWAQSKNQNAEVWFFNIERLNLTVMRLQEGKLHFDRLVPLNVWEKTKDNLFERQRVVEQVEDWLRRVDKLYAQVQEWLGNENGLRFEKTRKVAMSEELMQKFAVTDRELSILDILRGDQVVASFVPRGLWLIGAWGRIDIITREKTWTLVAIKKGDQFEWQLMSPDDRRHGRPFDKSALTALTSGQ